MPAQPQVSRDLIGESITSRPDGALFPRPPLEPALPMSRLTLAHHRQLEEDGYTVVKSVFSQDLCGRLRALMDEILGPSAEKVENSLQDGEHAADYATIERLLAEKKPLVTSSRWIHSIRHPICNHEGGIDGGALMAEATTSGGMLEIHQELLRCKPEDLRLMQHFARRTDPSPPHVLPPKGAYGATDESPNPGWHVDGGFVPSQYESTPKQIFYHSMTALCDVQPGGGAIMILPECFRRVKAALRGMEPDKANEAWSVEHGAYSIGRVVEQQLRPELDLGSGIEVLLEAGDLFIVDPSMLHAATPNTRGDLTPEYRRYVLFSTFFDKHTTDHLLPPRGSSGPAIKFAPDMRAALPQKLHSLFDWTAPSPEEAEAVMRQRIARM